MDYLKLTSNKKIKFMYVSMIVLFSLISIIILLSIRSSSKIVLLVLVVVTLIISLYPSKNVFSKVMAIAYLLLLIILLESDLFNFVFIPQAKALLDVNTDIIYWFTMGHPHAVRLLVSYPGYLLSQIFNIELDLGFSYYCISMFTLMYLITIDTVIKLDTKKKPMLIELKMFFCILPFIILPFIMNGRIIASYLGFSILINLFIAFFNGEKLNKIKILSTGFVGFILTTMSSGTMTVALLYIVSLSYILLVKKSSERISPFKIACILLIFSPVIYKIIEYSWIMFMRNINFFGGGLSGFINMFSHGAGRIFMLTNYQMIIFLLFLVIFMVLNIKFIKKLVLNRFIYTPIILGINISLYGLLFGYSTGLMAVPPLIVLVLICF